MRHVLAEGGGNAGPVEPISAGKNLLPIKFAGSRRCDGRAGSVVNYLTGSLGSAFLNIVNTQTITATKHHGGIHAELAQRIDCTLPNIMGRHFGNKGGIQSVICQRDRHIGLAAGIGSLKFGALGKAQVAFRIQAEHDLAKGNDSTHNGNSFPILKYWQRKAWLLL